MPNGLNTIRIILKSGREITLTTDKTVNDLKRCMNLDSPGSHIDFENKDFIMCSEVASMMQID